MPHFEHGIVLAIVDVMVAALGNVVMGVRDISSRSVIGRRDARVRVAVTEHAFRFREIAPDDPSNMPLLLAFERRQAFPQSICLKDVASRNILSMLTTLDTSQFERSRLNDVAQLNISGMC